MTALNAIKKEEKTDHSYTAGENKKCISTTENNFEISYKNKDEVITWLNDCTLVYPRDINFFLHKTCPWMFIAVLFEVAKTGNKPIVF